MLGVRQLIFIFVVLLYSLSSFGQSKSGNGTIVVHTKFLSKEKIDGSEIKGHTFFQGNQAYYYAVEGAVALLQQNGDTLKYAETDQEGQGLFKDVPYGKYSIEISHLGYAPFTAEINHNSSNSVIEALLTETGFMLDEIKVKGNIPLILKKGDTLVVNPVAVETQQGAAAIEIIKQVPGIEISNSGAVMVFGEPLKRSYVGGSTLFGTGVLTALNTLDANLIKSIKFYDEEEYLGAVNGKHHRQKVRVMNIETTKQLLSSINGHVLAGLGRDLKESGSKDEKLRYKSGASFNMFNEKSSVNVGFYANNVGLNSGGADFLNKLLSRRITGENSLMSASLKVEKKKGDNIYEKGSIISVSYDYNKNDSEIGKSVEREYYPTEYYTDRVYRGISESRLHDRVHRMGFSYTNNNAARKIAGISWEHQMEFGKGKGLELSSQRDISDKLQTIVKDSSLTKLKNWRVTESLIFGLKSMAVTANLNFGENDGTGFRTVEENGLETLYKTAPVGKSLSANVNMYIALLKWGEGESRWSINMPVEMNYAKGKKRYFRYDITDASDVFDAGNSWYYSNNHWDNKLGVSISNTVMRNNTNHINFDFEAGLHQTIINDNDLLKGYKTRKRYYSPYGKISAKIGVFDMHYGLVSTAPSLEQLRGYIDDSNVLYLRVGNPNLDATHIHSISFGYRSANIFTSVSYWQVKLRGELKQNSIIPYTLYYPEGGVLQEFGNYKVAPGVTIESYSNVDNEKKLNLSASYTSRISAIRTKFTLEGRGEYMNRYSCWQDVLNQTQTLSGALNVATYTSFRWLTLNLRSVSEYVHSSNSIKNDYKYFNQKVDATLNLTLFRLWYINSSYNLIFNKPTGGTAGVLNRNNIFNIATGITLLKGGLKAGFSVFDIFNSSTDFRTMQYADYVQNTWTPTFGRHFSFDVVFLIRKHSSR
ncbi:MAG: outer membrane beta-barrel protein [Bacteroidales bacterium]|nr:outer membrane beta-barrel protein [Bacteroidales bacterium]